MNELTELEKIYKKNLNEMNNVELAIWFTAEGTTAYDMDEAADYLARITAERDERLDRILIAIHEIRKMTASDPDNIWCRQATVMLNELYKETYAALKQSS